MEDLKQLCVRRIEVDRGISELGNIKTTVNEQILDLVTNAIEGSNSVEIDGFKIITTAKLNRTLDPKVWETIKDKVPPELQDVVVYKPSVNLKRLRMVEEMRPDAFTIIAEALTTKPATTSVKVVELD